MPLVAANDVHYHIPERRYLQDVLTCIREHCTLASAGGRLHANAERHLRPLDEIERLYAMMPGAIERTGEIAERCRFSLGELRYEYPEELCPPGKTPMEFLRELTWAGAKTRFGDGIPARTRKTLEHELRLIEELRYEPYFLTVWDLVRFARSRGILCQGRGSAANSAVCYCLGITAVDPDRIDLLFERFVSRERNEPPDIDVDFEHERREEVFQYIYGKYGRERAGITAEVITYRPRSAVRDVGKALGLSLDRVDVLAKKLEWWGREKLPVDCLREAGLDPNDRTVRALIALVGQIAGFPRHLSQHVGGFVITQGALCELVPIENGAMPGRTFIEWDKDDIDALGILKVDCLALGMLTCLRKCFDLINSSDEATERRSEEGEGREALKRAAETVQCHRSLREGQINDHRGDGNGQGPGEQTSGSNIGPGRDDVRIASSPSSLRRSVASSLSLDAIPPEDPAVYDMLCRADSVGVFQVESRAQMSMLPRLRPRCFYDLVIEVAIVRPGPIQGGMVHPYLRRRSGQEAITYPNPAIQAVLCKTLGVPLFQEQAMRLAVVAAGFSPGEADQLRRVMGAWRRPGVIEKFREGLIKGMMANGLPRRFAEQTFEQICGFGEYGFPESHAASFALLVYASAWLKLYYPAAYAAALINSQPMGFYAPAQIVRDAQQHGVEVRGIDVNHSSYDCTLEEESDGATERRSDEEGGGGDKAAPRRGSGQAEQRSDEGGEAATERRSDEGNVLRPAAKTVEYHRSLRKEQVIDSKGDGDGQDISRSDCLAKGDGAGGRGLSCDRFVPHRRPVRPYDADAAGGGIGPVEYRRRPRQTIPDRLSSLPPRGSRIVGGTTDTDDPLRTIELSERRSGPKLASRGGGSNPPGFDSQPGKEAGRDNVDPRRVDVRVASSPSSLRRSVASSLRLGMRLINGLSPESVRPIETARRNGPFRSIADVAHRAGVRRGTLARLAAADAFRSLGLDRRQALWDVLALREELPLLAGRQEGEVPAALPQMSIGEQVVADYDSTGLSLTAHPIALVRDELSRLHVVSAERIRQSRHGTPVRTAGLVLVRQRPGTAAGIVFATLEDESGITNLIIRPAIYERFRTATHGFAWLVEGRIERAGDVVHVQASRIDDLSDRLARLRVSARNFQ
jgi:DNA polymerase III alpha subunit